MGGALGDPSTPQGGLEKGSPYHEHIQNQQLLSGCVEGISGLINPLKCLSGLCVSLGRGTSNLSTLASNSCGVVDSRGSWKGSRREVAWRWVAISHLHLDCRPGRELNKNDQEDREGGGGGWVSLQPYNVGGLWPETTPSWVGALDWKTMKITSLCPIRGQGD